MILRKDIEYIVHCEPNGVVIGPISKVHAHLDCVREKLTHFSTWSMVYNPIIKKYGIQLKNVKIHDKYSGGKWDMGVAGHNCYVKKKDDWNYLNFEDNLIKEAEEEIGLKVKMYKNKNEFLKQSKNLKNKTIGFIIEKFHYEIKPNNEYVGLGLILTTENKLNFTDNEVIDFKWMTSNELKKFMKTNNNYCHPLEVSFKKSEKFIRNILL